MKFRTSGIGLVGLLTLLLGMSVTSWAAEQEGIGSWGVNDPTYGLKTREFEPGFTYTPSPADWRDINIYQLFTDRFADSGVDQLASYKPGWKTEGKISPTIATITMVAIGRAKTISVI